MIQFIKDLIKLLDENPRSVFVVFTVLFGAGMAYQTIKVIELSEEVGGLRATTASMHEIIKLKGCQ